MTPAAVGSIMAMAFATTPEQVQDCARQAMARGATALEVTEAIYRWELLQDATVRRIQSRPSRCHCGHTRVSHPFDGGCWGACPCDAFDEKERVL